MENLKSVRNSRLKVFSLAIAGCSVLLSQAGYAEPTGYNQISYTVDASAAVENDEVTAALYKKAQASTPKQLAIELNTAINQAMKVAKRYPSVTVTTGSQNTYPKYKDEKIVGWTGSIAINLKSNDFAATSELVANLQETLVMQNIQFGISKQKQDAVKNKLMIEASKAFKDQAKVLTTAWGSSGYQVVAVSLNTNGGYIGHPPMVMMATARMDSVPEQSYEGGDSEVTVIANGTIELIPWMQ